jgi:hypothetical protein
MVFIFVPIGLATIGCLGLTGYVLINFLRLNSTKSASTTTFSYSVTMRLNQVFTSDYLNRSSSAYRSLASDLQTFVREITCLNKKKYKICICKKILSHKMHSARMECLEQLAL